ncbi:MAG: cbb3-type cytochrome oxidase assembly protein CcoS [Rubripirellula sp.]|nr:cbb3-type cytochrome oxidase assembly protein CcoS [Rubripirellula sp.]
MSVMYVALPIAIALGATALWACVRAIRNGQFDDLDSPPMRMLIDDKPQPPKEPTDE